MKHMNIVKRLTLALALVLIACAAPAQAAAAPDVTQPRYMDVADAATAAAIQAVIQQANQEQQQALAQNNPGAMQDTATPDYYNQLVQTNQDLKTGGVTSIQLLDLRWGRVSLTNAQSAHATTLETWRTTYADGSVDQSTDRNVYALVLQNGAWKIQADQHPDSAVNLPFPGDPSGQPAPAQGAAVSGQSLNWSGYEATGGTYSGVSGSWTVPHVSGGSSGADATWVGIGGVQSRDLIQAGTEATVMRDGQVHYDAWIEMLPRAAQTVNLPVNPGDVVTASIARQDGNQWQISLKNTTNGQSFQQTVTYDSSASSAEWIEEAPTSFHGIVPLDGFGSVQFSAAAAVKNGQSMNAAQAGGQPITMINRSGQPLATPSALGTDGGSFTVSRAAAGSTQPAAPPVEIQVVPGFPFGQTGIPRARGFGRFPF